MDKMEELYNSIINDVVDNLKGVITEEGLDEQILTTLKDTWLRKPRDCQPRRTASSHDNVEIVKFDNSELVACDWFLLTDLVLKNFCECLLDKSLDSLASDRQLVLARSCLSDVIYAMHFLGLWCTKKTVQLYITEFSRLIQSEPLIGDLISALVTMLNCLYGRLDELSLHLDDVLVVGSSAQLRSLLEYIKEFKPAVNSQWPICIIHVQRRVIAKVLALWLDKVAKKGEEYSFISPNYTVGSIRKNRNHMAVDNFDLHHETALRDFRFGKCNTLVTTAITERYNIVPKCNLIVSFDPPSCFSGFMQAKSNCRYDNSKYIIMINSIMDNNSIKRISNYIRMELILNSNSKKVDEQEETTLMEALEKDFEPYPSKSLKNPATIWRSVNIINKYCSKLPRDSFTKLLPEWEVHTLANSNPQEFYCEIRLPINSPVRQKIIGPVSPTKNIAMRLAAFTACKELHRSNELDDNMMPITKESMKTTDPLNKVREAPARASRGRGRVKGRSIGSTKHRQYYKKRIAEVFSGPVIKEGLPCYLYEFKMELTCPIPDEQNRRGRRIIDPSETSRNYAIVCSKKLPKVCSFPVFTRSGEVLISVILLEARFELNASQVQALRTFHEHTFSKVLRLDKYPTIYEPDKSPFIVLLAPVVDEMGKETKIDWDFVDKIVNDSGYSHQPTAKERRAFKFNKDDYVDAVVIPWYRLTDRQQFAYYVADICTDLTPQSPFPDESSGFKTFIEYYQSKYNIEIFNTDQPVLDVDHTSARLNLLTPRYVNRKGRTLPSSTAKTRKESRESLIQKQLLIPELCSIHPFPASFWRKAVCLPCIFYRLNSLFLAEELRRKIANDTKVGFVEPNESFEWPPLSFGWSLKDVYTNQNSDSFEDSPAERSPVTSKKISKSQVKKTANLKVIPDPPTDTQEKTPDFVIDHFDASKYHIPNVPLDAPQGDWMNITLISSSGATNGDMATGWDQPIEQQNLLLESTNELSWSDCEMDFEGEISEKASRMRCGSPSSFEPNSRSIPEDSEMAQQSLIPPNEDDTSVCFPESNELVNGKDEEDQDSLTSVSDTSWCISEEDNADVANSEDGAPVYGEWKESKVKSKPSLREIFLPSSKTSVGASSSGKLESLFQILRKHVNTTGTQELPPIKIISAPESDSSKWLIDALGNIFEGKVDITQEQVTLSLEKWYSILRELDLRVDAALNKDPELFEDEGVEVITVDDGESSSGAPPTFGELLPDRDVDRAWPVEDWKNIKFDPIRSEIDSEGPGPSVILQALTMSNASDGINLERLETVGDSFLKYSITAYLYCTYPSMHEGKLSYLRSTEISNANLYKLGMSKDLGEIMSATKFEPNDNWLAPGYTVAEGGISEDTYDYNKKREIDRALAEVPYDLLQQHSIPDKSIADCVEALIGAYLTASGSRAALLFMQWLGLNVIPESFNLERDLAQGSKEDTIWRWLEIPPSPLICLPPTCDPKSPNNIEVSNVERVRGEAMRKLDHLYQVNCLEKFENEIQYSFKDKAYLVQAFTHNSFYENHVTDCHQRLEFLGDALLDYLITRYLFEDPRCHSPGTLTDLRSALVNNTFFASLAVKYKFHEYLKYISDELFHVIDKFVKKFKFDSKDSINKGYTLLISEGESEYAEDIEVPKALGDVFESVAGAIYLDSGMSLDQVWKVYSKMMKPEIEYFSKNVPKSPIRELLESMPQTVRFSPSELAPDRKHRVIAEVFGLGRFIGVGRSKHSAKSTAAKRALRMLALRKKEQESKLQQQQLKDDDYDGDDDHDDEYED